MIRQREEPVPIDLIHQYHDLLGQSGIAAASQEFLENYQRQHGLYFGERPLCSVLRPRFLSHLQYQFLRHRVRLLCMAFAKAQQAALADDAFRAQFGLTPQEDELVRLDPGFACAYPTSRLDAFYVSEDELYFTEFNSETPAGPGYNHALTELFFMLPAMREFQKQFQLYGLATHVGVIHALLAAYEQWSGSRNKPTICILDWAEVPTYSEFRLFEKHFHYYGLDAVIADPREVEYTQHRLYAKGRAIDLIYKRVLISELLDRGGMEHPVIRAVRAGDVCMINPLRCKILFKKASFAVLTDEQNSHLFTSEERAVILAHIPWTRVVEERQTLAPGASKSTRENSPKSPQVETGSKVDLVPYILANKDQLVLKPNDDYGGKGIVLGWTVDSSAWEAAVQTALQSPYIVQERVNLPKEPFPNWIDDKLVVVDRMVDTDPYILHGQYMDGSLCRISTADLLNVTAGGGSTVPTFVVEKR